MSQTLVGKSRGGQKLETFDLTEMCSLAKGKEVQELRHIVASVSQLSSAKSRMSR